MNFTVRVTGSGLKTFAGSMYARNEAIVPAVWFGNALHYIGPFSFGSRFSDD